MASDQLNFLIFEPDQQAQQWLRRLVMGFSIRSDADVRMDWLSRQDQFIHLPTFAADAHIALLSADHLAGTLEAGNAILQANPHCLIVCYGHRAHDLKLYFPARPIAYVDTPEDPAAWDLLLRALHRSIRESSAYFRWTSKFCRYYIPCSQILALRSAQGNLQIQTLGGTVHTVPGKLDEAQARLPQEDFLRIHKSTLVNVRSIRGMDRSDKCLILRDGSRAYISKVHYKAVSQYMNGLSSDT